MNDESLFHINDDNILICQRVDLILNFAINKVLNDVFNVAYSKKKQQ